MLMRAQTLLRKRMTMIVSPDGIDVDTPPRRVREMRGAGTLLPKKLAAQPAAPAPPAARSSLSLSVEIAAAGSALHSMSQRGARTAMLTPVREGSTEPGTPLDAGSVPITPLAASPPPRPRSPEEDYVVAPPIAPRVVQPVPAAAASVGRGMPQPAVRSEGAAPTTPTPTPPPTPPTPPQPTAARTPALSSAAVPTLTMASSRSGGRSVYFMYRSILWESC